MLAYKFRLLHEDQDDFLRDIEIKPTQTFKDLHDCVIQATGLSGKELASFFVCDYLWRKKKEITLINMLEGEQGSSGIDEDEDEEPIGIKTKIPIQVMSEVRIKDLIEDPHQRFLYEYDFLNPKIFYLELIKISDIDEKKEYPVIVKSMGTLSANSIPALPVIIDEADEQVMLKEFDEFIDKDGFEEEVDENFTTEPEW
jgi:hypothetical protein